MIFFAEYGLSCLFSKRMAVEFEKEYPLSGGSGKPRVRNPMEAFFLVMSLIQTDIAKEVRQALKTAVVLFKCAVEWYRFQCRVFPHKQHVFMFGMVLKIRIQAVAETGVNHIKEPADVVIKEGNKLWKNPVPQKILPDLFLLNEFFQYQQMPLFVVLLVPRFFDEFEDPPGKTGVAVGMGHRDIGNMLPRLVRYSRDDFKNFEFR